MRALTFVEPGNVTVVDRPEPLAGEGELTKQPGGADGGALATAEALERAGSLQSAEGLLQDAQDVNGVTVLAAMTSASNNDSLREISDWLRDKLGSGIVVLGAVINERPTITIGVTPDLVTAGTDARD